MGFGFGAHWCGTIGAVSCADSSHCRGAQDHEEGDAEVWDRDTRPRRTGGWSKRLGSRQARRRCTPERRGDSGPTACRGSVPSPMEQSSVVAMACHLGVGCPMSP